MKTLLIIGTGGTIAGTAADPGQTVGYTSGAVPVSGLVSALPGLPDLAHLRTAQPFSLGSEHLTSGHWLILARMIREALTDPQIDGIVVTHGTDTLEETAFFLDLVIAPGRPIVLTGAMRPATAIGSDGPSNLTAACRFALAAGGSRGPVTGSGPSVMVAFNDCAFAASSVHKIHTTRVDAFAARNRSAIGTVVSGTVHWHPTARIASHFTDLALPDRLPDVALIWQHVDCDASIVDWHLQRGTAGIVIAGTGNGTMTDPMRAALARASAAGCRVVRATRVPGGPVIRNAEADPADCDDALGFIAAGWVAPLKARLLLQCCLLAGLDLASSQQAFDRYD